MVGAWPSGKTFTGPPAARLNKDGDPPAFEVVLAAELAVLAADDDVAAVARLPAPVVVSLR